MIVSVHYVDNLFREQAFQRMYLPNPSTTSRMWHKIIFKPCKAGLNSEFSSSWIGCLTKAKELSLPYYLSIAGERTDGFMPFSRTLMLIEMQPTLSRIWTRVTESISADNKHLTKHTLVVPFSIVNSISKSW